MKISNALTDNDYKDMRKRDIDWELAKPECAQVKCFYKSNPNRSAFGRTLCEAYRNLMETA